MQYPERFVLQGSERHLPEGDDRAGDVDPEEPATVTVYVRAPSGEADGDRLGAAPGDVEAVRAFAEEYHLSVSGVDQTRRAVTLSGRLGDLERAFGTSLGVYVDRSGRRYRGRTGPLEPPLTLEDVMTEVRGLDEEP